MAATDTLAVETRSLPQRIRSYGGRSMLAFPVSFAAFLTLWELASRFSGMPSYILPGPETVLSSLVQGLTAAPTGRDSFAYHLGDTIFAALLGFAVGSTLGIAIGALIAEFRIIETIARPYVSALQSMPKVAFAPLFVIWFGIGLTSKIAMSSLISLFPPLVNSIVGIRSVEQDQLELMRSLGASRWKIFWAVKFPTALPYIFAALELGIVYALLGVIVAEFVAAQRGMGLLITAQESIGNTAGVFAVLIVLGTTAAFLGITIRAVARRVMFWRNRPELTK